MKEIEILVEVFDKREQVLRKLKQFNFCGEKETFDVYFFDPKREELKPDNTGALDQCLRLRKKAGHNFLAYKIDHFDKNNTWIYSDEHEIEVSDFNITQKILKHLGLAVLVDIKNKKHTYKTDQYEIVLEEVEKLGLFLEVEILKNIDNNADIIEIKKEIWNFIKSLNIKTSEELNMGKPELMLKKTGNYIA